LDAPQLAARGCAAAVSLQGVKSLIISEDECDADVKAQVVLNLKIRGAHRNGAKYSILQPVIEGFKLNAILDDADELEGLEKICSE
jgi:hypothetical protein